MRQYLNEFYTKELPYPLNDNQIFDNPNEARYVYVFANPITKLCKIGITKNVRDRFMKLRNSAGVNLISLIVLDLEFNYDEKAILVEEILHKYFKEKRKVGEWFNLNLKDIIQIRNLFWSIEGSDVQDNVKEGLNGNDEYPYHQQQLFMEMCEPNFDIKKFYK
jgi:hypothetical protein